ncbi:MAG TPA: hypothetical protein VLH08_05790, partial [Acidobacteriota bacterium]|nr:hypothetical protein [Acidobacteriota bacterium]
MLFPTLAFAQGWVKTIGGSNTDHVWDVHQKSDGTYILSGVSSSFQDPTSGDAFLVKLDASGNILWQKTYGDSTAGEAFTSVRSTSDGGYIAAGILTTVGNAYDVFVVKTDVNGVLTWRKRFNIQSNSDEAILSVRESPSGGYLLGGYAVIPSNGGDPGGLILKLNNSGALVWHNRYEVDCGTPDTCGAFFKSLEATSDGGAIAIGASNSSTDGRHHLWFVKISSSGGILWQKKYNQDVLLTDLDTTKYIVKVISGGYLSVLSDGSYFWVLKLDSSGNIISPKLYTDSNNPGSAWIFKMDQSSDGNFFLGGLTNGPESAPMLVKLDANGNVLWSKISQSNGQWIETLSKTSDNGVIIGGPFLNGCNNDNDFWIVKVDSAGNSCEFPTNASIISLTPPSVTNSSVNTTVVASGLSTVTTNAIASNSSAVQRDQCNAFNRQQTECGLTFDIANVTCDEADTTCIDNRKVLISKMGTTDEYPSEFQRAVAPPKDRKIKISGTVSDSQGSAIPNRIVYLRVIDPPDSSPYVTPPTPGDNVDKDPMSGGIGGKLDNSQVSTDNNGRFETVLNVITSRKCTDQGNIECDPAGDNYQVEGSFTSDFGCGNSCAKSGIVTAWKRLYVERDQMFRRGGLLFEDARGPQTSPSLPGQTSILVYGWADLPPCDDQPSGPACYQIALFDSLNTYELLDSEKPWVGHVVVEGTNLRLHLVTGPTGGIPYQIQKPLYSASPYPSFVFPGSSIIKGKSAGIGVISSGFYEFSADITNIKKAFERDAFTELSISPDANALPYLSSPPSPDTFFNPKPDGFLPKVRYSRIWFNNCVQGPDWVCLNNNYFHLMSVSGESELNWGRSYTTSSHASFTYTQTIELRCSIPNYSNCKQHNATHEIAHQFSLNTCGGTGDGHDDRFAWC